MCAGIETEIEPRLDDEDVTVEVSGLGDTLKVSMDIRTLSLLVEFKWFTENGGVSSKRVGSAYAASGRVIYVMGSGMLSFSFWGVEFTE